jgi:hypothetical protein
MWIIVDPTDSMVDLKNNVQKMYNWYAKIITQIELIIAYGQHENVGMLSPKVVSIVK